MNPNPILNSRLSTVVAQPGWWQRNWKIALPIMIATPIMALAMCAVGASWGIDKVVRQSETYQQAWPIVRHSPQVIAQLGQPIAESWAASIALDEQPDGSSVAYLVFNIHGPQDSATVESKSLRKAGVWRLQSLKVHPSISLQTIDLMPPAAP